LNLSLKLCAVRVSIKADVIGGGHRGATECVQIKRQLV
jgi:hypothetical protein